MYLTEQPSLQVEWKDIDGNLYNPDTVTVDVIEPREVTATRYDYPTTITRPSTGIYRLAINPKVTGVLRALWIGTKDGVPVFRPYELTVVPTPSL